MKKDIIKKCIIVGNGKKPQRKTIEYLKSKGFKTIICADGGANYILKMGFVPDYIIGDLDSFKESNKCKLTSSTELINIKRQSDSDIEKSIRYAKDNEFTHIALLSVIGKRIDHTLCNLSILLKYSLFLNICIYTKDSIIIPIVGDNFFHCVAGDRFSIFAFDDKTKISTKGLVYPLKNESLRFGIRESLSNVSENEDVEITVENGIALAVMKFVPKNLSF